MQIVVVSQQRAHHKYKYFSNATPHHTSQIAFIFDRSAPGYHRSLVRANQFWFHSVSKHAKNRKKRKNKLEKFNHNIVGKNVDRWLVSWGCLYARTYCKLLRASNSKNSSNSIKIFLNVEKKRIVLGTRV